MIWQAVSHSFKRIARQRLFPRRTDAILVSKCVGLLSSLWGYGIQRRTDCWHVHAEVPAHNFSGIS